MQHHRFDSRIILNFFYDTDFVVPHRLIVSTMGFLAVMLAYTIRTSLSLSITKMVVSKNHSESAQECIVENDNDPVVSVSNT